MILLIKMTFSFHFRALLDQQDHREFQASMVRMETQDLPGYKDPGVTMVLKVLQDPRVHKENQVQLGLWVPKERKVTREREVQSVHGENLGRMQHSSPLSNKVCISNILKLLILFYDSGLNICNIERSNFTMQIICPFSPSLVVTIDILKKKKKSFSKMKTKC